MLTALCNVFHLEDIWYITSKKKIPFVLVYEGVETDWSSASAYRAPDSQYYCGLVPLSEQREDLWEPVSEWSGGRGMWYGRVFWKPVFIHCTTPLIKGEGFVIDQETALLLGCHQDRGTCRRCILMQEGVIVRYYKLQFQRLSLIFRKQDIFPQSFS